MVSPEILARISLRELPGVGDRVAHRIAGHAAEVAVRLDTLMGSPVSTLRQDYHFPKSAITRLERDRDRHESHCAQLLGKIRARAVRVVTTHDPGYPERWRTNVGCPPFLCWIHGDSEALNARSVAILSSRHLNAGSVSAALQVVQRASQLGLTIVTGGMKTTHRIVAVAARAALVSRIVVLDRGILSVLGGNDSDPFSFGPTQKSILYDSTLILSSFRPFDHGGPQNGPRRDELVGSLGDAIVAVQARPGGGTERICLSAFDRGRPVFAWHEQCPGLAAAGVPSGEAADLFTFLAQFKGI